MASGSGPSSAGPRTLDSLEHRVEVLLEDAENLETIATRLVAQVRALRAQVADTPDVTPRCDVSVKDGHHDVTPPPA